MSLDSLSPTTAHTLVFLLLSMALSTEGILFKYYNSMPPMWNPSATPDSWRKKAEPLSIMPKTFPGLALSLQLHVPIFPL